jgi:uncharacterized membrane protein YjjP (DUF1212 family)
LAKIDPIAINSRFTLFVVVVMKHQDFFRQITLISLLLGLALWGLYQLEVLQPYQLLGWISMAYFFSISLLIYLVSQGMVKNANPNAFIRMVMGFVLFKLMLSVAVVVVYFEKTAPSSKYFILPFFLVYLVYTIFETYFLMKISKSTQSN